MRRAASRRVVGVARRIVSERIIACSSRPWICLLLLSVAWVGCSPPAPDRTFPDDILDARAAKDLAFLEASDSPVPPNRRDDLLPITYFAPDLDYRVAAALRPEEGRQPVVEMPTSTGKIRPMQRMGYLEFSLKGEPLSLACFLEVGSREAQQLFIPFSDLSTGVETYAAGRYIDLDWQPSGLYELDFNLAYHPYCYFDVRFDCPFPPTENRLPVPIRAGERLPVGGPGDPEP